MLIWLCGAPVNVLSISTELHFNLHTYYTLSFYRSLWTHFMKIFHYYLLIIILYPYLSYQNILFYLSLMSTGKHSTCMDVSHMIVLSFIEVFQSGVQSQGCCKVHADPPFLGMDSLQPSPACEGDHVGDLWEEHDVTRCNEMFAISQSPYVVQCELETSPLKQIIRASLAIHAHGPKDGCMEEGFYLIFWENNTSITMNNTSKSPQHVLGTANQKVLGGSVSLSTYHHLMHLCSWTSWCFSTNSSVEGLWALSEPWYFIVSLVSSCRLWRGNIIYCSRNTLSECCHHQLCISFGSTRQGACLLFSQKARGVCISGAVMQTCKLGVSPAMFWRCWHIVIWLQQWSW